MAKEKERVEVAIGDGVVVLKRERSSNPVIAGILGVDRDESGEIETIWLDRLVHKVGEDEFVGWSVSGAVSSILRRNASKVTSLTVHQ
jgi:hypothetical protein